MRSFKLFAILIGFYSCLFAQDSIKIRNEDTRSSFIFSVENNYNYRYVRVPTGRDKGIEKIDYLDTCNIACNMKSFSIRYEIEIFKFITFQGGIIYGRKGYMGCRDVTADEFGRLILIYTESTIDDLCFTHWYKY
jgi:hypothetical protein